MRTIVCSCDATFEENVPEIIDLDASQDQKRALLNGSFMAIKCPTCGRVLKPEFPISVRWPSRGIVFFVVPELDRPDAQEMAKGNDAEILIGYAELVDRIAVIEAGFDPVAIEALKYYLLLKASEANPDAEPTAWFHTGTADAIEFHIHGLRPGEVAVSRIPRAVYERTLAERNAHPENEPYCLITKGRYISVQNLFNATEA